MGDSQTGMKLNGNHYEVEVDAYTIDEVSRLTGIDLLSCFDNKETLEQLGDIRVFLNVLRVLMDDSCERHGTTGDREFAKLFKEREKIDEAFECFVNSLINFFPSHQREPLQALMAMSREAEKRMREKSTELCKSDRFEKLIELQLDTLESRFSSALASLESEILADGHSGN